MPRLTVYDWLDDGSVQRFLDWRARVHDWYMYKANQCQCARRWLWQRYAVMDRLEKLRLWPNDKPVYITPFFPVQPFMAIYGYEDTRWAIAHYELQKGA